MYVNWDETFVINTETHIEMAHNSAFALTKQNVKVGGFPQMSCCERDEICLCLYSGVQLSDSTASTSLQGFPTEEASQDRTLESPGPARGRVLFSQMCFSSVTLITITGIKTLFQHTGV